MINGFAEKFEYGEEFVADIICDCRKSSAIRVCAAAAILKFLSYIFNFCGQFRPLFLQSSLSGLPRQCRKNFQSQKFARGINERGHKCVILLSHGILREPIKYFKRAPHVFLAKFYGQQQLDRLLEQTIPHYPLDAEIIECVNGPQYLQTLHSDEQLPLESLCNKFVAALSGIAIPEGFEKFISKSNTDLVYNKLFIDHHRPALDKIQDFFLEAQENSAQSVIAIEKDAARLPKEVKFQLPTCYLRLEIDILTTGNNDLKKADFDLYFPKNKMRATRSRVGV